MPTDATAAAAIPKSGALDEPRVRRILRFVIAVTSATAYSCYVNWSFSFLLVALIIPLVTMPTPAPSLRFAVWTVAKLMGFIVLGLALMVPLHSHQIFGFALLGLILFVYFYLQAQGRVAGLNATFLIATPTRSARSSGRADSNAWTSAARTITAFAALNLSAGARTMTCRHFRAGRSLHNSSDCHPSTATEHC